VIEEGHSLEDVEPPMGEAEGRTEELELQMVVEGVQKRTEEEVGLLERKE
jgi:hypothetical protein